MIRCEAYEVPPLSVYATCDRGVHMTARVTTVIACDHGSAPCTECRESARIVGRVARRLGLMVNAWVIAVSRANYEKRRVVCAAHPWPLHTTRCSVRA